jgi:hypothetical protein
MRVRRHCRSRSGSDESAPEHVVEDSGFRVQAGIRIQDSGFRVQSLGCRVQGSGFRVQGLRFRV